MFPTAPGGWCQLQQAEIMQAFEALSQVLKGCRTDLDRELFLQNLDSL